LDTPNKDETKNNPKETIKDIDKDVDKGNLEIKKKS
jgi:hypothetical protein